MTVRIEDMYVTPDGELRTERRIRPGDECPIDQAAQEQRLLRRRNLPMSSEDFFRCARWWELESGRGSGFDRRPLWYAANMVLAGRARVADGTERPWKRSDDVFAPECPDCGGPASGLFGCGGKHPPRQREPVEKAPERSRSSAVIERRESYDLPEGWPVTLTVIQWDQQGRPVAAVWRGKDGAGQLVHCGGEAGAHLGVDGPHVHREHVGVPPVWADALKRIPQDCECVTHFGPHWLDYDFTCRVTNAGLLWYPGVIVRPEGDIGWMTRMPVRAYAMEEVMRLRGLRAEMARRRVESLTVVLGMESAP